jgi:hypothetical protein
MTEFAPSNIKRMRWLRCDKEETRLYRFSQPILKDGSTHMREHFPRQSQSQLNEQGLRLINKIIGQVGIASVDAYCHEVYVTIYPIFEWSDGYHDFILQTINWTLFDNGADILGPETPQVA